MKNALLEEIWAARERIARKNGYNLRRTVAYLRGLETKYPGRVVALQSKKPDPAWLTLLPKVKPVKRKRATVHA